MIKTMIEQFVHENNKIEQFIHETYIIEQFIKDNHNRVKFNS